MQETDGGLGACFAAAGKGACTIAEFAEEGVESLADFVGHFTVSGCEKEAENVRDKVESLKGRTVDTARIRTHRPKILFFCFSNYNFHSTFHLGGSSRGM